MAGLGVTLDSNLLLMPNLQPSQQVLWNLSLRILSSSHKHLAQCVVSIQTHLEVTQAGCGFSHPGSHPAGCRPTTPLVLFPDCGPRTTVFGFLGFFPVLVSWLCGFTYDPSASKSDRLLGWLQTATIPLQKFRVHTAQVALDLTSISRPLS